MALGPALLRIPAAEAGASVVAANLTRTCSMPDGRRPKRAASTWSGWRPTSRRCRSRTVSSTSCCPPSARCSHPTISGRPTSSSGCASRRDDRDDQLDTGRLGRTTVQGLRDLRSAASRDGRDRVEKLRTDERTLRIDHFTDAANLCTYYKAKFGPTIAAYGRISEDDGAKVAAMDRDFLDWATRSNVSGPASPLCSSTATYWSWQANGPTERPREVQRPAPTFAMASAPGGTCWSPASRAAVRMCAAPPRGRVAVLGAHASPAGRRRARRPRPRRSRRTSESPRPAGRAPRAVAGGAQDLGQGHAGHGEQPEVARLLRAGDRPAQRVAAAGSPAVVLGPTEVGQVQGGRAAEPEPAADSAACPWCRAASAKRCSAWATRPSAASACSSPHASSSGLRMRIASSHAARPAAVSPSGEVRERRQQQAAALLPGGSARGEGRAAALQVGQRLGGPPSWSGRSPRTSGRGPRARSSSPARAVAASSAVRAGRRSPDMASSQLSSSSAVTRRSGGRGVGGDAAPRAAGRRRRRRRAGPTPSRSRRRSAGRLGIVDAGAVQRGVDRRRVRRR